MATHSRTILVVAFHSCVFPESSSVPVNTFFLASFVISAHIIHFNFLLCKLDHYQKFRMHRITNHLYRQQVAIDSDLTLSGTSEKARVAAFISHPDELVRAETLPRAFVSRNTANGVAGPTLSE